MRFILPLLFLSLLALNAAGQNAKLSGPLKHLKEVEKAPTTKDCEGNLSCTLDQIRSYVVGNIKQSVLATFEADSVTINLKFIVDQTGQVAWAKALGGNEAIRTEGVRAVKNLPALEPGAHEGQIANVLIDLPIKLKFQREKPFAKFDTPPYLTKCEGEDFPLQCTSEEVNNFVNRRIRSNWLSDLGKGKHSILISFEIDSMGNARNFTATGGNASFNKKAIKVVEKLPAFVPATLDGKNVSSTYELPIFVQVAK